MRAQLTTAACALALLAASPAHAGLAMGAQDDGAVLNGGAQLDQAVSHARSIGATRFRVIVSGTNGLGAYDAGLARLAAEGFEVQITLTTYRGSAFVADAMRRWPTTAAWSFWNEPELTLVLRHGQNARGYRAGWRDYYRLHRAGYRLARQLAPQSRVLIGEVSSHATLVDVRHLVSLPGDGIAIHPYQRGREPTRADRTAPTGIGRLRAIVRVGRPKPVYITEFGYKPSQQAWWRGGLQQARRWRARELVAYQMTYDTGSAEPGTRRWDTSLYDRSGAARRGAVVLNGAAFPAPPDLAPPSPGGRPR